MSCLVFVTNALHTCQYFIMYDRLIQEIDKSNFTVGIFVDLSKAFDTVDHDILLVKMKHCGIRGHASD